MLASPPITPHFRFLVGRVKGDPGDLLDEFGLALEPGEHFSAEVLAPEGSIVSTTATIEVLAVSRDREGRTATLRVAASGVDGATALAAVKEVAGRRFCLVAVLENGVAHFSIDVEASTEPTRLTFDHWYAICV